MFKCAQSFAFARRKACVQAGALVAGELIGEIHEFFGRRFHHRFHALVVGKLEQRIGERARFFLRRGSGGRFRGFLCRLVFRFLRGICFRRRVRGVFCRRSGLRGFLLRHLLFEFRDENFVDEFLRWIGGHRAFAGHDLADHAVGRECLREFLRAQSEGAIGGQMRAERAIVDAFGMELVFNPGVHPFGQNLVHFARTRAEGEAVKRMQGATAFELSGRFGGRLFILRSTLPNAYRNVARQVLRRCVACGRSRISKHGKEGKMTQLASCHREVCAIEKAAPREVVHIVTHEHRALNNTLNPSSRKMFLASI